MLRQYLGRIWEEAEERNRQEIISLLPISPRLFLDLGCDDGSLTGRVSAAIGACRTVGVEIDGERAAIARSRGLEVVVADLNCRIPLDNEMADAIMANQVIEHLRDTDNLLAESWRLLKPGGTLVVSTENLASWHNILALVMGWQPFSLTNISSRVSVVGNPLSLHRGTPVRPDPLQHVRVFAARGLLELVEAHLFKVNAVRGAGYFPVPTRPARAIEKLDIRHAAFITIQAFKLG
jgi:SAM-dependent methyltransferase